MIYLYHKIPKCFKGNILYPLNILKEKYPEVYEKEVSKYTGREHITKYIIPILDCLWNDALHFSAVNPEEIKQAFLEVGYSREFMVSYYKIDPKLLDPKKTVVFLHNKKYGKNQINKDNFIPYNPNNILKYSSVPQDTKDYYKEKINKGEKFMTHAYIPHILYKGAIDVTNLQTFSV